MTQSTTTLVVHDHGDPIASGIAEILADWHASGWVSDVALVSIAEVERRGGDVGNVVVTLPATLAVGPRRLRVKDLLDNPNIRLVALDPVGPTPQWTDRRVLLKRAADRLEAALRHRHAAIDVVVPWHGGWWEPDALEAWRGWDTVIAAPEEAVSIQSEGIAIYCDLDNPVQVAELAGHAAAFTASMVGMWSGIIGSPFDHTDAQDDIRIGRCAHRRLDASALADRMRSIALDPRNLREPGTLHSASRAEFDKRVKELGARIALAQRPAPPRPAGPAPVGWMDAIKAFFAFMWAALRGAPQQMVAAAVHRGKASLAAKIQQATYGQNSAYIVMVGGVSAAEADISLGALTEAVDALAEAVATNDAASAPESSVGVSQRQFWSGVFDTAFALVSGARQGSVEPYSFEGKRRHFKASEVAPRVGSAWQPATRTIAGLPDEGIETYDILGIGAAQRLLNLSAEGGSAGAREAAERDSRSLTDSAQQWTEAFMGRVGGLLARGVNRYAEELQALVKQARAASLLDQRAAEVRTEQKKSRRRLFTITGVFATLVGLSIVLHFTLLPALSLLIMLPILVLGWLVSSFVAFYATYKKIFMLQHQLDRDQAAVDDLQISLPIAVENARRLVRLYAQYLVWARAMSVFLNEPYGRAERRPHEFLGMVGAMPRSVSCGIYEVVDEGAANTCVLNAVQGTRYPLTNLWGDFARAAHQQLVRDDPQWRSMQVDDILSEAEVGDDSYLALWLRRVVTRTDGTLRVSDTLAGTLDRQQMARILDQVERLGPHTLDELRGAHRVRQVGDGGVPSSHRISAADTPADFNKAAFSMDGIQEGARHPDPEANRVMSSSAVRSRATRHWLDEVDTAVSLSPQLTFGYLQLLRAEGQSQPGEVIGVDDDFDPPDLEDLGSTT